MDKIKKSREIWDNKELRCGGFYELSIEVTDNNQPQEKIEEILNLIYELDYIHGPFDNELNKNDLFIDMENGYGENLGCLEIKDSQIPFKTVFIREQDTNGSNWVDLCFYTAMYEYVLGNEYKTWSTKGKWHQEFDELLIRILKHLNTKHKIRIGVLGFEVSGMYSLKTLKERELTENDVSHTKFFVNKDVILKNKNWDLVNEL